jgi:hypothetical protein
MAKVDWKHSTWMLECKISAIEDVHSSKKWLGV